MTSISLPQQRVGGKYKLYSTYLADHITEKHFRGKYSVAVIEADPWIRLNEESDTGVGKSVYALKTAAAVIHNVLNVDVEECWETALNLIVFKPTEIVEKVRLASKLGMKLPVLIWDDAGYWLNKRFWNSPLIKSTIRLLQVFRPKLSSLILTTPQFSELAFGIRERVNVLVRIGGIEQLRDHFNKALNRHVLIERRKVYIYALGKDELWKNKLIKRKIAEEEVWMYIPDNVYAKYEKLRLSYVREAEKDMVTAWKLEQKLLQEKLEEPVEET
ncbi:MAG: hypothetical protein B6U76_00920 [Desulfurococcales archaeon ex4484_217_2]|nr:MAG: hypothetical protein B6U76_00920 [Desulfurococcales archaeon ex4484_217_2]